MWQDATMDRSIQVFDRRLGERLGVARRRAGLSTASAASATRISEADWEAVEEGNAVSLLTLVAMASTVGVRATALLRDPPTPGRCTDRGHG